MKRSVRTTFIGLFIGLMAIVLLAVWAMNSFFLEKYYLNDKVNILQDTYTQINAYAWKKLLTDKTLWMISKAFIPKMESKMKLPG